MDARLEKAIRLINEFASDPTVFLRLIELGKMLELSEARDLLEQISNALSDEIFNQIAARIDNVDLGETLNEDDEISPCMLSLENWTQEDIETTIPYFLVFVIEKTDLKNINTAKLKRFN